MKMQKIFLAQMITIVLTGALASCRPSLPPDPDPTCTVTEDTIDGWFVGGKVVKDGPVTPAASTSFPNPNTDCDFYKWGSRMFLWLTSSTTASSGGGMVFDSGEFFDVSPADSQGNRTLIANTESNSLQLRSSKPEEIGETGQAGSTSGVLISQAGSLLYYGIHVNDVYAYFLSMQKNGNLQPASFPTTTDDLTPIEAYAGKQFADGQALALELKTSWVDASTVVDKSRFITITAEVPTYDKTSTTQWTPSGNETIELALVGMHIVGSALGHPEMIWATFEHVDNAPDNTYYYTNAAGETVKKPYEPAGDWLLMEPAGVPTSEANKEKMLLIGSDIVAQEPYNVEPSNTYRKNPWGSTANDMASAANNTLLISINDSVLGQLADGDVRKNYILYGAIWTQNGGLPPSGTQEGSLQLANSTLETYKQDINCFTCHSIKSPAPSVSTSLSHIYDEILPLPNP